MTRSSAIKATDQYLDVISEGGYPTSVPDDVGEQLNAVLITWRDEARWTPVERTP